MNSKSFKISVMALFIILLNFKLVYSQEMKTSSATLEKYIQEGLSNNLSLQQEKFNLEKSYLALKEARDLYHPTVTFQSDISAATGGRKIDLPLGDLLNPVYANLNELNNISNYPQLQNQQISLLPSNYQDTRLKIVAPLVNYEIRYINQFYKEAISEKQAKLNVFKRELVLNIQVAYYHYLQSENVVQVYKNANDLLQENLRYTRILLKNGVGIKSDLLIVQAKISKNNSLLVEARNKAKEAAAYFNFLINKPRASTIEIDTMIYVEKSTDANNESAVNISTLDEINQLKSMIAQTKININKERAYALPQLGFFMDAGVQGTDYRLNADDKYMVGGIQLKWNIYNGSKTSNKIKQARKDQQTLQLKLKELENWIQTEHSNKKSELESATIKLKSSRINQELLKEFFRETQVRYREGQALTIEWGEAFTQMINAQLECQIDQTNILIKQAEIEKAASSFKL